MLNGTLRVPVPAVDTSQCAFARFAAEGDSHHTIHNYEEWAAYSAVYSIKNEKASMIEITMLVHALF